VYHRALPGHNGARSIKHVRLDGSVPTAQRQKLVDRFNRFAGRRSAGP
jgi:SNF2 family DNA or RNA helicase